jgi:hypothetical protein
MQGEPMNEQSQAGDEQVLDNWVADLAGVLGLDPSSTDVGLLLDVARDAAHNVARTAAPLTTFLVGLAAGQRGGTTEAVVVAANQARQLAQARGEEEQTT